MPIYHKPRIFAWLDTETTGLTVPDAVIEVAFIITDEHLTELDRYESLVRPFNLGLFVTPDGTKWRANAIPAFKAHNIQADEITSAPPAVRVSEDMIVLLDAYTGDSRPIMVTDNPPFDERMLKGSMFSTEWWPFHYNVWSPNMLTAALGLKPPTKPHRAMGDVEGMLDHCRQALDMIAAPGSAPDFT